MNDPFAHRTVTANGIKQHWVEAGSGPPLILLHGFPLFWYQWRKMMPELSQHFRVIAPDLRGYGSTAKPPTGYDKRTMAQDLKALLEHLGIGRAAIVGHDRGARVATRFAKDHPEMTSHLCVMDNIPTLTIFETLDAERAKAQWWFLFNAVPGLPEMLIRGREEPWLRFIFSQWSYNPECISGLNFEVYLKNYQAAGAVEGALRDYSAGVLDVEQDKADQDVKIAAPTLVLWGEESVAIKGLFDIKAVWSQMATHPNFVSIPQCSHLPPEEQPELVNRALLDFLSDWKG